MRHKRIILSMVVAAAILIGLAFGHHYLLLDRSGRPTCHKGIMLGFLTVMHPGGGDILKDPKPFPNVRGLSQESLATIRDSMAGHMEWAKDYNCVPGLWENDPADLVLLYFNRPTRWTWHGARPPTTCAAKAWMIIPVDFGAWLGSRPHTRNGGECSERVSLAEFRNRLSRTLDFVRTNQRPNWQTVVAEHEKFLSSIEHDNR
jgi:hypothetical protein